ncbi:unnamed protein product [Protopolystoma xenopodis]|uniref:Uncharacterized protein n=1 Tax=Protopolystoma xenopodis TaxID=117903 RepID=A0A448WPY8_9PLAT|nr:unnamed protein product [Protopolystoma xenopodis]
MLYPKLYCILEVVGVPRQRRHSPEQLTLVPMTHGAGIHSLRHSPLLRILSPPSTLFCSASALPFSDPLSLSPNSLESAPFTSSRLPPAPLTRLFAVSRPLATSIQSQGG